MRKLLTIFFAAIALPAMAQFAPQQGLPGSTAISASDPSFTMWANGCVVHRGYMDIDTPSLGYPANGDSSCAIGAPDGITVSLGDSGVADVTFPAVIYNGPGADFAVFENGFGNPANDSQAFLELAFVEVSSDGSRYVRFPAQSLTQTASQIAGAGQYMYANLLNNLAGKYIALYGTPFDLQELADSPGLDINNVTHVRVVDVIGAVHGHSSFDADGRVINDPFPTNFNSGGFDLDAVGAIYHVHNSGVEGINKADEVTVYPVPASGTLFVRTGQNGKVMQGVLTTVTGAVALQWSLQPGLNTIDVSMLPAGTYFVSIQDDKGYQWQEKVIKY